MIIQTKNNRHVLIRRLMPDDFDRLFDYLQHLGPETIRRFGPHPFDKASILDFYRNPDQHLGYIAEDTETQEIIAYSIIKAGYLEHDGYRLQSYGLTPDAETDCTFAPSVADKWQGLGIGSSLFGFILTDLKALGKKRVILWGGVQSDNLRAVNYYLKHGFRKVGQFEHHGPNDDMILEII